MADSPREPDLLPVDQLGLISGDVVFATDEVHAVVGDDLRRLRIARRMSMRAVAKRARVSPTTVRAYEQGRISRADTLVRIAGAVGATVVRLDDLVAVVLDGDVVFPMPVTLPREDVTDLDDSDRRHLVQVANRAVRTAAARLKGADDERGHSTADADG